MVRVFDPSKAKEVIREAREAFSPDPLAIALKPKEPLSEAPKGPVALATKEERMKADFRLFLIELWRHLLGKDPAPIMLDMAWWLQHGPDRAITMAFRGFSKSWITGAYALWRLYNNPQEKILVVSGSLTRSVATTNWCLTLIQTWKPLAALKPKPNQRQSSKAFDVGPALPDQTPSFHAVGIGGQLVGFRATCIIPDDVETQTNSLTITMREKVREAVKEFESVLKPQDLMPDGTPDPKSKPPVIKYLGTPHDEDSLYNYLLRGEPGRPSVYQARVWPARYPDRELIKRYGERLAPYITQMMDKLGPECVGKSTMPNRFPDSDLALRESSMGRSEFALQFMLDTSMSDRDKFPLKLADLMVLSLDPRRGPEKVSWSGDATRRMMDLPAMGFDGDYYHAAIVDEGTTYSPYTKKVAFIDTSGRGADETAMSVVGELFGNLFWLHLTAMRDGFSPRTLSHLAMVCVRFEVNEAHIEENFGGGTFTALFTPVLHKAWESENQRRKRSGEEPGGTQIVEVRASQKASKERRILQIMEPVTQFHRLVVNAEVIKWDFKSLDDIESTDTRLKYAWGHQYTRLTRTPDSLLHDDRIDSLAGAIAAFSDVIGVDPSLMARRASESRLEDELMKLLEGDDENGLPRNLKPQPRAVGFMPAKR